MSKFIGQIVIKTFFLALGLFVTLFFTYVVLSVSKLFDVKVILDNFNMMQLFGFSMILKYILNGTSLERFKEEAREYKTITFSKSCWESFQFQLL